MPHNNSLIPLSVVIYFVVCECIPVLCIFTVCDCISVLCIFTVCECISVLCTCGEDLSTVAGLAEFMITQLDVILSATCTAQATYLLTINKVRYADIVIGSKKVVTTILRKAAPSPLDRYQCLFFSHCLYTVFLM